MMVAPAHNAADLERLTESLKHQLEQADQQLHKAFQNNEPIFELVTRRAELVSDVLRNSWQPFLGGSRSSNEKPSLALIAVGGFGRGELHPYSDIDLLVLNQSDNDQTNRRLETWIGVLWNAGLAVSHSVRSLEECCRQADQDVTVVTNLMEARLLAGDENLFQQMLQQTSAHKMWPARAFFAAKLAEQEQRHSSFDDTAYKLEPNLKEGPGGLRDIQTIAWVARRQFGDADLTTLVGHGFLLRDEYNDLINARDFLWRVRWINHCITDRPEERLLFAQQKQLAAKLGYQDSQQATRGVEQFMQQYYRTVTSVERLNERLLQQYREELLISGAKVRKLDSEFQVRDDYIEACHPSVFDDRPLAIMDLFLQLQADSSIKGVRAGTIRWLRQALKTHGEQLAQNPRCLARFMDILRQPVGVYSQLARMNRYGLLARLIPGFSKVTGLMQFDLFHIYTVDQHTLFVIRNLRRFAYEKHPELFTHAGQVFQRIDKPELLYLAALFHDIAKGRGGDHSELGAQDAREFGARLNLAKSEVRLVSWLVENHLLLSRTAQREDISDPDIIHRFALDVADREHLDYLYLLTVADIAATNPDLWNSWKDMLLWDLYQRTASAFQQGLSRPLTKTQKARETRSMVFSQLVAEQVNVDALDGLWRSFPEQIFERFDDDQLLWVTQTMLMRDDSVWPLVELRSLEDEEITELLVVGQSFDGFFATVIGELDKMRCNIFNARIQTTKDDLAVDIFQLIDASGSPLNGSDCQRLRAQLSTHLRTLTTPETVHFSIPRRLREFLSNAIIHFSRVNNLTKMEVRCTDRPGLLSCIASVLLKHKVRLHDARIATFGEHVEDSFLLSDYANKALSKEACASLQATLQQALDAPL